MLPIRNNFYNEGTGHETIMFIRRSRNHALRLFVRRSAGGNGVVVSRAEKVEGSLPDLGELIGPVFHSPRILRKMVLWRMKKSLINKDDGDIHDD